jgi:hypothetical protein
MSFSSTAIASGIAGLTISGVTVKDLTGIPQTGDETICPILFPSPEWVSGGNGEPSDGPMTFGTPTTRLWQFNRTYKYIYLHCQVGAGALSDIYSGMSGKADAIMQAFTKLDITDVDVQNVSLGEFGALQDPSGKYFHGFTVSVTLRERLNND